MIYKEFQGLKLSALGFGAMRLPTINGQDSVIDEEQSAAMVDYAMNNGINYYDTAWGYHAGNSELVMGKILKQYPRNQFYLASKFPGYDLNNMGKVEEIFEKQLEKCQVDYFDFYLIHNVCEMNIDAYLDRQYGIMDYLLKQKEAGRIKYIGFSIHGGNEVMRKFLEAYGEYMEFGQIQLNYIDWTFQDAKTKVDMLRERNIPVWVMEPLRGGKLAAVNEENSAILREKRPDESVVSWAFRFLQGLPEVKMILSGMSNMEQLKQNVETFASDKPLNSEEQKALMSVAANMISKIALPCTSCGYCLSHCPQELNIPELLNLYNEFYFTGGGFIAPTVIGTMPEEKRPSACIGCRSCEAVCPQQIKISDALAELAAAM